MNISKTKVEVLLNKLSIAFWAGKRWVAFPVNGALLQFIMVRFYKCFINANKFCEMRSKGGRIFRFGAIADIMKQLKCYEEQNSVSPSPAGEYIPVVWIRDDGSVINIVRLDKRTGRLKFYDGRLRKSLPGLEIGIHDDSYFAFNERVKIVSYN